jgi:hypothetical protein
MKGFWSSSFFFAQHFFSRRLSVGEVSLTLPGEAESGSAGKQPDKE